MKARTAARLAWSLWGEMGQSANVHCILSRRSRSYTSDSRTFQRVCFANEIVEAVISAVTGSQCQSTTADR